MTSSISSPGHFDTLQRLTFKPSKLDLLDSTTLTSFPLAHPIPNQSHNFHGSVPIKNIKEISDNTPLVMIEDYVKESTMSKLSKQKSIVSITEIKSSIKKNKARLIKSCSVLPSENQSNGIYFKPSPSNISFISIYSKENLNALSTFSKLSNYNLTPASSTDPYNIDYNYKVILENSAINKKKSSIINENDVYANSVLHDSDIATDFSESNPLKYCVMCEKPMYEISSIIPPNSDCNEIVCEDCFRDYESIYNLLKNASSVNQMENIVERKFYEDSYSDDDIGGECVKVNITNDFDETIKTLETLLDEVVQTTENSADPDPELETDTSHQNLKASQYKVLVQRLKDIKRKDLKLRKSMVNLRSTHFNEEPNSFWRLIKETLFHQFN